MDEERGRQVQVESSATVIDDVIWSAESVVEHLRSRSSARLEIQEHLHHVRSGILRLAEAAMLLRGFGSTAPGPDGQHDGMPVPEHLRDRLLRAWGYTSFMQYQIDSRLSDRIRLAEYGEGLLEELVAVQEQLTVGRST